MRYTLLLLLVALVGCQQTSQSKLVTSKDWESHSGPGKYYVTRTPERTVYFLSTETEGLLKCGTIGINGTLWSVWAYDDYSIEHHFPSKKEAERWLFTKYCVDADKAELITGGL